jgi:predicted metal-dependent HD superfamily phosphohydrolase
MQLKDIFMQLVMPYCNNAVQANHLWLQIEKNYSSKKRHYHNLTHIATLADELQPCKEVIKDWDMVLFAVFYHDIVYNVLKKDNEEKSAVTATGIMQELDISKERIATCNAHILATKAHNISTDFDTDLFTDADLSILGKPLETYKNYCSQIRKEYAIYPDFLYQPGRKKVVEHFLQMERIYKTDFFYNRYEAQARNNLKCEMGAL